MARSRAEDSPRPSNGLLPSGNFLSHLERKSSLAVGLHHVHALVEPHRVDAGPAVYDLLGNLDAWVWVIQKNPSLGCSDAIIVLLVVEAVNPALLETALEQVVVATTVYVVGASTLLVAAVGVSATGF
jgi:hypothetical protein